MAQLHKKIAEYTRARQALADLSRPFIGRRQPLDCREIQPARMPPVARRLLTHHQHMTIVLAEHYGLPMDIRVLKKSRQGDRYTRKILLLPHGSQRVVEAGIVRLNFACTSAAVRNEILAGRRPLGEILTAHNVLRRIEPLWFVRFAPGDALGEFFGLEFPRSIYGRLAMIYCNGEPAIELLETLVDA